MKSRLNRVPDARAYAAVWRWHFYAGLFVAPWLVILAVTGAIYLFNTELNDLIYPGLTSVTPSADRVAPHAIADAVSHRYPGSEITRMDWPTAADRSVTVFVTPTQSEPHRVFVNPYTGAVLGSVIYTHTLVGIADTLHGSLMLGLAGDILLETAACWAAILVITGVYLWWPRGGRGRSRPRGVGVWRIGRCTRPRPKRRFWRDLHAVVGTYVAVFILFFVSSGLPWGDISGGWLLRPAIATLGVGYPQARIARPTSTLDAMRHNASWSLAEAPVPRSRPPLAKIQPDIGLDAAVAELHARGMIDGFRLSLPTTARGVYTGFAYPNRPQGQRTIHIDRYNGRVLADVDYHDYGLLGRLIETGVALHMGNYFGLINQLVLLSGCIGIITLVTSGLMIWWRRRPPGAFAAPARQPVRRRWIPLILLIACVLYPLAGASLLLIMLIDRGLVNSGWRTKHA